MNQETKKRQYVLTKRNGRIYKVYLADLLSIKHLKKRLTPKVP
jgi:hypothetical protein